MTVYTLCLTCISCHSTKKLPLIEVGPTALARPMTLTLSFNSLCGMVMAHLHANIQGQQSVHSEHRVETNGRKDRLMEAIALLPSPMQWVTNWHSLFHINRQKEVTPGLYARYVTCTFQDAPVKV